MTSLGGWGGGHSRLRVSSRPTYRSRGAWLLLLVAGALLAALVTVGDRFGRSIILDLVSLWPALAAVLVMVFLLGSGRRRSRSLLRFGLMTALPLSLLVWVVLVAGLHGWGWDRLPSSSATLLGPGGGDVARLPAAYAQVGGVLILEPGGEVLYQASPLKAGGGVAPPEAEEVTVGDEIRVTLMESAEAGWFASAGWRLALSPDHSWAITVRSVRLEASLDGVPVRSLDVEADGEINMGRPIAEVPISLLGELAVQIPADVSIDLRGQATVGPGWTPTSTGAEYRGPAEGRYLIDVLPGSDVAVIQI